jgi:adenylate kinase family enzyme
LQLQLASSSGQETSTLVTSLRASDLMHRINIIGAPGSGKTTLARKLSEIYDLPVIHMDYIGLSKTYDAMNNKPAFQAKIKKECEKERWIIEGVYKATLAYRVPRAELTILLDYPRYLYVYRVFKRRIQYHGKQRPEMIDGWKERINWPFFKYVWTFPKKQLGPIKDILSNHKESKIQIFRNPKELQKYVSQLK